LAIDKNNQFEFEIAAFQSFTRYSSELIKRGKPCDITHAYIELHTRAGELLQREVKTDDYKLPTRTVSPDELFEGIFDWISTQSSSMCTIIVCLHLVSLTTMQLVIVRNIHSEEEKMEQFVI